MVEELIQVAVGPSSHNLQVPALISAAFNDRVVVAASWPVENRGQGEAEVFGEIVLQRLSDAVELFNSSVSGFIPNRQELTVPVDQNNPKRIVAFTTGARILGPGLTTDIVFGFIVGTELIMGQGAITVHTIALSFDANGTRTIGSHVDPDMFAVGVF